MLNRTNRKLYRSLRGEYKRYARRLKNTLFDCCCGKDAVNDSLSDEFIMLAEAQSHTAPLRTSSPTPTPASARRCSAFPRAGYAEIQPSSSAFAPRSFFWQTPPWQSSSRATCGFHSPSPTTAQNKISSIGNPWSTPGNMRSASTDRRSVQPAKPSSVWKTICLRGTTICPRGTL